MASDPFLPTIAFAPLTNLDQISGIGNATAETMGAVFDVS
jgi:hypothetical protein